MAILTGLSVLSALLANGVGVFTALGAVLFPAGIGAALAQLGAKIATSYLVMLLQGRQKGPAFAITGKMQAGEQVPRMAPIGKAATEGSLVYANEWGQLHKTPNAYFTSVIALSDLPVKGLLGLMVDGIYMTLDDTPDPDVGYPVLEKRVDGTDYLWVKFYDGTQTAADPWLVAEMAATARPYADTRVGHGVAYAICTARINQTLFSGLPSYRFVLDSIPLYDVSKDATAGGDGDQSWDDPETWGGDGDYLPVVQDYNIRRGLKWNGQWVYGFQGTARHQLPDEAWIDEVEACREEIENDVGMVPRWRAGGMLDFSAECGTAMEQIMAAAAGRIADCGGIYTPRVGRSFTPVAEITDDDWLTTEEQGSTPFKGLADMINAVAANYPEPDEGFNLKAAPTLTNSDLEEADGNRRLPSTLTLANVPYGEQVQRLQKIALAEAREESHHRGTLSPRFWGLEPNDVIVWTSTRFGYVEKLFRVDAALDRKDSSLDVDIVEVNEDGQDWTPAAEFTAQVKVPVVANRAAAQTVPDFDAAPVTISAGGGLVAAPGIRLTWDGEPIEDANGIKYQVRLAADESAVTRGFIADVDEGLFDVGDNLVEAENYKVRARPVIHGRATVWSDWIAVTAGLMGAGVSGDIVYREAVQTLTQKTISATSNAITGLKQSDIADLGDDLAAIAALAVNGATPVAGGPATLASTGNLTLSGEQTIDGTLTSTTRFLAKDQSALAENGLYVTGAGAWTRATDMNTAGEFQRHTVYVTGGIVNTGRTYYCTDAVGTVGTDPVVFALVSPALSGLSAEISARIAGDEGLAARVPEVASGTVYQALAVAGQDVAVWLENGDLGAKGMTDALRLIATSGVVVPLENGPYFPIIYAGRQVIMYGGPDGVFCPPLDAARDAAIAALRADAAPRMSPRSSELPIATDGRSLTRLWAKLGGLKAGSGKLKIVLAGDSWSEREDIPQALSDMLDVEFTVFSSWHSAIEAIAWGAAVYAISGWTSVDGSSALVTSYPYGCGPDGNLIHATSTTAMVSYSGVACTNFKIYSRKHSGTWRWRVDGGAWTTVTEGSGGALTTTHISGLSDTTHTIEIDTTGNAGRVVMVGYYGYRTGVAGVEILKLGNSSTNGIQNALYCPLAVDVVTDLAPDAVIQILGTNDYRQSVSSVTTYMAGQEACRDCYRDAVSDVGFIFVIPAQSDGTVITPLSDLRDALYEFCLDEGHEFYNMLDDWGSFAAEDALGQWSDTLHINALGANRLARRLGSFFGIRG